MAADGAAEWAIEETVESAAGEAVVAAEVVAAEEAVESAAGAAVMPAAVAAVAAVEAVPDTTDSESVVSGVEVVWDAGPPSPTSSTAGSEWSHICLHKALDSMIASMKAKVLHSSVRNMFLKT